MGFLTYIEGVFLAYFIYSLKVAIEYQDIAMIPLLLFLIVGYSVVFFSSIFHWKRSSRQVIYDEAF